MIDEHGSDVWLVNTGWTGGAFGVGKRMKLSHTRAMVHALLRGDLHSAPLDDRSGLRTAGARRTIAGVPDEVLNAARHVDATRRAYDAQAKKLAGDVPRELREVREVGADGGDGVRAERVIDR